MNSKEITTYADLVIEQGVNLRKGQSVVIQTCEATYYFARALAKSAYAHQAKFVHIRIMDLDILSSRLENQDNEALCYNPEFEKVLDYQITSEQWAYIGIDAIEDRLFNYNLDADKNQAYAKARKQFHSLVQNNWMRDATPWTVVAAPSELWAKKVLGDNASIDELFNVLKPILLLDAKNPILAWQQKDIRMQERADKLNNLGIESLHYSSLDTDFTIGFCHHSQFLGGSATLPDGRSFFPNLPTEELFTTPDRTRAEGYITTTKPVSVLETTTEQVRLTFKAGRVVDYSAKVGKAAMDRFFSIDEGTHRIGECALVDEGNPIAQSNLLFSSILYDENASCHIALGAGYPKCLTNSNELQDEQQLESEGCNQSLMHIDFMVGSKEMQIIATCKDGKKVQILRNGRFVL